MRSSDCCLRYCGMPSFMRGDAALRIMVTGDFFYFGKRVMANAESVPKITSPGRHIPRKAAAIRIGYSTPQSGNERKFI